MEKSGDFFDGILQKTSMSTYCINGRPKLSLTQCFPMEKLSRKNIAFSPSMQFIFEKPYYLTNMSRWPSGLRHRQIILATKVAWVRSPVPPKISFLNLIFYLAPECIIFFLLWTEKYHLQIGAAIHVRLLLEI